MRPSDPLLLRLDLVSFLGVLVLGVLVFTVALPGIYSYLDGVRVYLDAAKGKRNEVTVRQ